MNYILSIIIPVYNVEQFLDDCLSSVISQIRNINNIELILVDDGSIDKSFNICNKYNTNFSNVRFLHQSNQGVASARNLGLQNAHGEYICFVDSDDVIAEDYIAFVLKNIKRYNFDVLMFNHKNFFTQVPRLTRSENDTYKINKKSAMSSLEDPNWGSYLWNKIIRKDLFNNIEFPVGRNYEDLAVMYKIFNRANSFFKSNNVYYLYRQNPSSIMHTFSAKNKYDMVTSEYELYIFLKNKYPDISNLSEQKFLTNALGCLHDNGLEKKYKDLINEKISSINLNKTLNKTKIYKLEWWTYNHFKVMFKLFVLLRNIKEEQYLKNNHDKKQ